MDRPSTTVQPATQNNASSCSQQVVAAADDDSIMTIVIDDRLMHRKPGKATKDAKTNQSGADSKGNSDVKHAACPRRLLVRTATLDAARKRPAGPWVSVELAPNDRMFAQFKTGCALRSKATHRTYMQLLSTARKMCSGVPTEVLVKAPDASIVALEKHATDYQLSPNSVTSYLGAILAVIKHTVSCDSKAKLRNEIAIWQAAHKKWQLRAQQPYLQNRATEKQQAGWISYGDFCRVRDGLPDGSKAKLLFAMYSHIPPCRADLGACRIFVQTPTTKELADFTGNYIYLQRDAFLHLRQFKTQRCYGPNGVKVGMPAVLVKQVHASLQQQPRSYLFTQEYQLDKPYSRSAFSTMANKTFQRCTGIPDLNIQLIRHSYCTHALTVNDTSKLDPCTQAAERALCEKRLANIAHCMCHSLDQQQRYRFTLQQSGAPQPISKKIVSRQQHASEPVIVELLE
jgi:hypothetical protein